MADRADELARTIVAQWDESAKPGVGSWSLTALELRIATALREHAREEISAITGVDGGAAAQEAMMDTEQKAKSLAAEFAETRLRNDARLLLNGLCGSPGLCTAGDYCPCIVRIMGALHRAALEGRRTTGGDHG